MQLLSDTRTGRRQRLSFSYQLPTQGRRKQGSNGGNLALNRFWPGEAEAKIDHI